MSITRSFFALDYLILETYFTLHVALEFPLFLLEEWTILHLKRNLCENAKSQRALE